VPSSPAATTPTLPPSGRSAAPKLKSGRIRVTRGICRWHWTRPTTSPSTYAAWWPCGTRAASTPAAVISLPRGASRTTWSTGPTVDPPASLTSKTIVGGTIMCCCTSWAGRLPSTRTAPARSPAPTGRPSAATARRRGPGNRPRNQRGIAIVGGVWPAKTSADPDRTRRRDAVVGWDQRRYSSARMIEAPCSRPESWADHFGVGRHRIVRFIPSTAD
jgi:hypothetical protein